MSGKKKVLRPVSPLNKNNKCKFYYIIYYIILFISYYIILINIILYFIIFIVSRSNEKKGS